MPDDVFIIPIRSSKVKSYAEIIEDAIGSSDITSKSININIESSSLAHSISGTFSAEHQVMKKSQQNSQSQLLRIQVRHEIYKVSLQPHFQLSEEFKASLLYIAALIENNSTLMAHYYSQLLIRNFGTHYLTSVTAGGVLVKDEYFKASSESLTEEEKSELKIEASYSYLSSVGMNGKYGDERKDSTVKQSKTDYFIIY